MFEVEAMQRGREVDAAARHLHYDVSCYKGFKIKKFKENCLVTMHHWFTHEHLSAINGKIVFLDLQMIDTDIYEFAAQEFFCDSQRNDVVPGKRIYRRYGVDLYPTTKRQEYDFNYVGPVVHGRAFCKDEFTSMLKELFDECVMVVFRGAPKRKRLTSFLPVDCPWKTSLGEWTLISCRNHTFPNASCAIKKLDQMINYYFDGLRQAKRGEIVYKRKRERRSIGQD